MCICCCCFIKVCCWAFSLGRASSHYVVVVWGGEFRLCATKRLHRPFSFCRAGASLALAVRFFVRVVSRRQSRCVSLSRCKSAHCALSPCVCSRRCFSRCVLCCLSFVALCLPCLFGCLWWATLIWVTRLSASGARTEASRVGFVALTHSKKHSKPQLGKECTHTMCEASTESAHPKARLGRVHFLTRLLTHTVTLTLEVTTHTTGSTRCDPSTLSRGTHKEGFFT